MELEFVSTGGNGRKSDFEVDISGRSEDGFTAGEITINWIITIGKSLSMIKNYDASVMKVKGSVFVTETDEEIDISDFELELFDAGSGTTCINCIDVLVDEKIILITFN